MGTVRWVGCGLLAMLLAAGGCTPTEPSVQQPAQPIHGKIEVVHSGLGTAVMNVGRRHGVLKGHVFAVTRGGQRIAEVRVTSVWDAMSAADIQPGSDDVAVGDDVASVPPQR